MSRRTTVERVQAALGGNYGTVNGKLSDLGQWIDAANNIVNQVVLLAQKNTLTSAGLGNTLLNPVTLELMERYTACYQYCLFDPLYTNRSTEGASGSFVEDELTKQRYKALACQQDPTGVLRALLERKQSYTMSLGGCP